METGLRGFLITGKEAYLEPYNAGLKEFESVMATEKKLVSDNPSQLTALKEIESLLNQWIEKAAKPQMAMRYQANKATARMKRNGNSVTIEDVSNLVQKETGKKRMDRIRKKFRAFKDVEIALTAQRSADASRMAKITSTLTIVFVLFSIFFAFGVGRAISRAITRPLSRLVEAAGAFAGGDLERSVEITSRDEVAALGTTFNRMILKETLSNWGMEPIIALGEDALMLLTKARESEKPFSLVLLESGSVEMDGFGLAEQLKAHTELNIPTIMMLSSVGMRGDARRCRELGISGYLPGRSNSRNSSPLFCRF